MGAVIENGKDACLVLEYMEKGSLYDILHNQTAVIEKDLFLPLMQDIISGIRFLHAANPAVVHGDLKVSLRSEFPIVWSCVLTRLFSHHYHAVFVQNVLPCAGQEYSGEQELSRKGE